MNRKIDASRPYRRIEIDKIFTKVKAEMHSAALLRGKSKGLDKALFQDIYTGKKLIGGDPYDYEHIRSSEEIHSKYKSILTDEQIALVVNCLENVSENQEISINLKAKQKMEDWLANPTNITANGIDLELTFANIKKADKGILKMVSQITKKL